MWFHGTVLSHPRTLGCGVAWQHSVACTPVRGRLHAPYGATWSMSPESALLSCCFWRWQIKWDTRILASKAFPCVGAPSIRPRNGISCWPSSFWRQYCIAWGPFGKVDWRTGGQWEGGRDFWRKFRVGPRAKGWVSAGEVLKRDEFGEVWLHAALGCSSPGRQSTIMLLLVAWCCVSEIKWWKGIYAGI